MGTVSGADLRTAFDASRAGLQTSFAAGDSENGLSFQVLALTSALAEASRSLEFTAPDDCELLALGLSAAHLAISPTVTCTLTQADTGEDSAPTVYILDASWAVSLTLSGVTAEEFARQEFTTTTNARLMLKRGVTYKLTLSTTSGTISRATGVIYWRVKRRTS